MNSSNFLRNLKKNFASMRKPLSGLSRAAGRALGKMAKLLIWNFRLAEKFE